MIRKIGISFVLPLTILVNLVQPVFWRITKFQVPISKQFVAKSKAKSSIGCLVYCSTYYIQSLATMQDGDCYCLTSHPQRNWTGENVILTSMMTRLSEPPDCISKEYTIYPELGNCIRYINTRKTWLDAERHCNQDGGYLINVDTEAKFNVSIDIALTTNQWHIYVGGFTTFWDAENTEYYWTRGSVLDRFWASGEPNWINVEPCMSIMGWKGLNNFACSGTTPFLCELLLL